VKVLAMRKERPSAPHRVLEDTYVVMNGRIGLSLKMIDASGGPFFKWRKLFLLKTEKGEIFALLRKRWARGTTTKSASL